MTKEQASTIAVLRCHMGCTYAKLGLLADAIWGRDKAVEMSGEPFLARSKMGEFLVSRMEEALGLERGDASEMEMHEGVCRECHSTAIALYYPHDVPKRCSACGKEAVFLPAEPTP